MLVDSVWAQTDGVGSLKLYEGFCKPFSKTKTELVCQETPKADKAKEDDDPPQDPDEEWELEVEAHPEQDWPAEKQWKYGYAFKREGMFADFGIKAGIQAGSFGSRLGKDAAESAHVQIGNTRTSLDLNFNLYGSRELPHFGGSDLAKGYSGKFLTRLTDRAETGGDTPNTSPGDYSSLQFRTGYYMGCKVQQDDLAAISHQQIGELGVYYDVPFGDQSDRRELMVHFRAGLGVDHQDLYEQKANTGVVGAIHFEPEVDLYNSDRNSDESLRVNLSIPCDVIRDLYRNERRDSGRWALEIAPRVEALWSLDRYKMSIYLEYRFRQYDERPDGYDERGQGIALGTSFGW